MFDDIKVVGNAEAFGIDGLAKRVGVRVLIPYCIIDGSQGTFQLFLSKHYSIRT